MLAARALSGLLSIILLGEGFSPMLAVISHCSPQPILTDLQGWRSHSLSAVLCQGCTTFTVKLCSLIHPEAPKLPSVVAALCVYLGSAQRSLAPAPSSSCRLRADPLRLLPARLSPAAPALLVGPELSPWVRSSGSPTSLLSWEHQNWTQFPSAASLGLNRGKRIIPFDLPATFLFSLGSP